MTSGTPDMREDTCSVSDIQSHLLVCDGLFSPPLSGRVDVAEYARKIRNHARTFEAWDETVLVGLVAAYVNHDTLSCYVTSVSVTPAFAGMGIATRLMRACVECARRAGVQLVTLEVSADNARAIALYEKLEFRRAERPDGSLLMTLSL